MPSKKPTRGASRAVAAKKSPAAKRPVAKKTARLAIGEKWQGGIYAGLTLHNNTPMHLVLLPGDDKMPWAKAVQHAKASDALLPSRFDGLALYKNVPREFQKAWYWTDAQLAALDACAWVQSFGWGGQDGGHESCECRVRLVRRLTI